MDEIVISPLVGILLALFLVTALIASSPGAPWETNEESYGLAALVGVGTAIIVAFVLTARSVLATASFPHPNAFAALVAEQVDR